jgi:ribosomal protein S18 acetylase RimI-like enzyme
MGITIRKASLQDCIPLAVISRKTFYDSFGAGNTAEDMQKHLETNYADDIIKAELEDTENTFLLTYDEDLLIGYCKLTEKQKPDAATLPEPIEIERIYALNTVIGKGIGKAMMEACIEQAKKKNKTCIWLGVWEHNPRAIAFYTKFGFEKFGEHIFVVGNDPQTDWLMKKML